MSKTKTIDTTAALTAAGADVRRATAVRNDLIVAAAGEGISMREIARLVGMSHTAVQNIIRASA